MVETRRTLLFIQRDGRNLEEFQGRFIGFEYFCFKFKDVRAGRPCASVLIQTIQTVSGCSKFIDKNQIIIFSIKYAMCDIHINDYYSKYFVSNDSNFILFHCDFIFNLLYDKTSADVILRF